MRPEIKCCSVTKKIMFALLFIAGEVKLNFVSGVVVDKQPIKKCKQIRARHRVNHLLPYIG